MANYQRIRTQHSAEIPVAAADYWKVLLDWAAIPDWMPKENAPVPLVKVELELGHRLGKLPCTRNCYFDTSKLPPGLDPSVLPSCIPETLLHVDEEARLIYYNMEGSGPFGMRNYLATTAVDELGPHRTRVTCAGRFDLPQGAPADLVKGFIEGVYEHGIIHGISALLQRRSRDG